MKASELNYKGTKFSPSEWPEGVLDKIDSVIILALFKLRILLGYSMWPSALAEAHVREGGSSTSQHYVGEGRLSTATDIHVKRYSSLLRLLSLVPMIPEIGGFGIYFNTNTPMFHIDSRKTREWWIVTKEGKYIYYNKHGVETFYRTLAEEMSKTNK